MYLTFEEAMKKTRTVSSPTAYEDPELGLLWSAACSLPASAQIVEIGCEYGRSTSMLLQIARSRTYRFPHLVDPFFTYKGSAAKELVDMLVGIEYSFHLHVMTTAAALGALPEAIDLVHIDGDHSTGSLQFDCDALLPRVVSEGYAVFHDYGRESLPTVKPVVDRTTEGWTRVGLKGTCLAVRKP